MTRALTPAELQDLERAWLLGTQRGPAPVPDPLAVHGDDAGLVALAWRAQQRQLTASPPRTRETARWVEAPDDPRPTFPDALRPALRRLVAASEARRQPDVLRAVAWWMRDAGVRLHPFDTWAMGHDAFEPCVGAYEAWLAEQAGRAIVDDRAPDATDETWEAYGPVARLRWLEARRREDPDTARALLEACWGRERADVRLRLLEALAVRPVPGDREFLIRQHNDRSKKVQALAAKLLAYVPGSEAQATSRQTLRQLVRVRRRFGTLLLDVAPGADFGAVRALVAGLHPRTVADDLGIDETVMFSGDGDTLQLAPAFAVGALRHDDAVTAGQFLAFLASAPQPIGIWLGLLDGLPPDQVRTLARQLLVGKAAASLVESPDDASDWVALMEGPLSDEGARALVDGAPFRTAVGALMGDDGPDIGAALARVAVLVPASAARDAVTLLEARGAMAAPLVQALWRLLADLHEVTR